MWFSAINIFGSNYKMFKPENKTKNVLCIYFSYILNSIFILYTFNSDVSYFLFYLFKKGSLSEK